MTVTNPSTGYALLSVAADVGSSAQSGRLESVEAILSIIDKILAYPLDFTRRPITLRNHMQKLCIFLTGGAYAPYATYMATPLCVWCACVELQTPGRCSTCEIAAVVAACEAKSSVPSRRSK